MSSPEISNKEYPLVGWIPTVNGRLSFRHIGESRHPTDTKYANVITNSARYIVAYQKRPLSDVLFQPILHYICSISGDFWFVLVAESISDPVSADAIKGTISIFKSRRDWRDLAENAVRGSILEINELRFSLNANRDEDIKSAWEHAKEQAESKADIMLGFTLLRTGEVYFTRPLFSDADLEYASTSYAREDGHDFSRWVADQAYFFLRDVTHVHQHHRPTSDTILVLQELDDEDINWRKNIIYSLYYYVIRSKRFSDAYSLFQSLGVQAYCKSFKGICDRRLGEKFRHIPIFDDEALAQSLNARAQEVLARQTEQSTIAIMRHTRAANWRTFALSIVALIVAAGAVLVQPRINGTEAIRFPNLIAASDFAATHFFTVFWLCVIFLVIAWVRTNRDWTSKLPWSRDLLELSNVRRRDAIILFSLLGFGSATMTTYFFWPEIVLLYQAAKSFFVDFWTLIQRQHGAPSSG